MIAGKFLVQSLDSGAYAAPASSTDPFAPSIRDAAAYAYFDAIQRAKELMALTEHRFRVISADLEWDFK